jgi:hypothetical protein
VFPFFNVLRVLTLDWTRGPLWGSSDSADSAECAYFVFRDGIAVFASFEKTDPDPFASGQECFQVVTEDEPQFRAPSVRGHPSLLHPVTDGAVAYTDEARHGSESERTTLGYRQCFLLSFTTEKGEPTTIK